MYYIHVLQIVTAFVTHTFLIGSDTEASKPEHGMFAFF